MDFAKLYRPSVLNSYQFIALTGLVMSGGAHLLLHFVFHHAVPRFQLALRLLDSPLYSWVAT